MTAHEKMIAELIEQGLIDEAHSVTPAGEAYTRALIAAYPNINKPKRRKQRHD